MSLGVAEARGSRCESIFDAKPRVSSATRSRYFDFYEKAYELFLTDNAPIFESAADEPGKIRYKSEERIVIDYLGHGYEGETVRVWSPVSGRSLLKVLKPDGRKDRGIIRQVLDYYLMNRGTTHPYEITGVDFFRGIIEFRDVRLIPIEELEDFLNRVGAPPEAVDHVFGLRAITKVGAVWDRAIGYDIDHDRLVPFDPH